MNPTELRAIIASKQLASLVLANAQDGCSCPYEKLSDGAIVLADMLLAKLDQSTPSPTRPALPWLDATDPDNDPSNGDGAWLAIKGRKGWTVVLSFWDKERSERFLAENGRYVLGHINHRDLDCYHCPVSSFATVDDAVASLPK